MDDSLVTSTASSSSFTTAPTGRWKYDVFLSFCGEDTRKNFVDHLYAALDQAGIYTFKDDEKLQRGESIPLELVKAIKESMVAVVVFSNNYANSCWCLEELANIIDCQVLMGQRVLPVFYDVDPSEVREQKRSFQAAFDLHEVKLINDIKKVKRWREALVTAANSSGWDVSRTASGREAECIKQIVWKILSYTESRPLENLTGMESRVKDVKLLLGKGLFGDVCILGIWGMGGIGKTTIARAVYHQISSEYESSSFVEDVRENCCNKTGLKSLQEKLLSEILMEEHYKVRDCDDGAYQIRKRLGRKKVLVVLDDVDNINQLEFLAGGREWFGPGSRILITTRDEHLLSYAQEKYSPELLNQTEAVRLFSRYAFRANIPLNEFKELSDAVLSYTGCLPLALKVLGSHFFGRNFDFWQSSLNGLTKLPYKEINEILKLSYDGLNILEKKMFLDIACFFKGDEILHVTRILDSLGFEAVSGLTVLIEKSLLTIVHGKLHMHDLIQEMGMFIVKECYPDTMLWVPEEVEEVMISNTRRENVEAIEHEHYSRSMTCYDVDVFKSMKKLRLLILKRRFTSSWPTCFPEQLRWLRWSQCPFESLTVTRSLAKLVGFEMPFGGMKQLQIEEKVILCNIKFMDLRHSYTITSFPDVTAVPNLESLILSDCGLVEIHQSVLLHDRIKHLDLSYCYKLKILPPSIQMRSLQTLLLNTCLSLERFPEVTREMRMLSLLDMNGCDLIWALPTSIQLLTGLIVLKMEKRNKTNILRKNNVCIQGSAHLRCLRILNYKNNDVVEDNILTRTVHNAWPSLEELDISDNTFTRLPSSISQLSRLKYLDLRSCSNLEELCELPSLVQVLKANYCYSLQKTDDLSNKYKWLFKISFFCNPLEDQETQSHLDNLLMKSFVQKCAVVNHRLSIIVRGTKLPNWFTNQRFGNEVRLKLPHYQITKMIGLTVCFRFFPTLGTHDIFRIKFKRSSEEKLINSPSGADARRPTHVWIGYMSINILRNLIHGSESEYLIITFEYDGKILECVVCVIYEDDINPMTGIGSRITDYDELRTIERDNASSENLQQGRWSTPTFSFGNEKTGDQNTIKVLL